MKYIRLFENFSKDINIPLEVENRYRKDKSNFSEDDILKQLGVTDDDMSSITFWTSLELGRDKYRDMSDDEFFEFFEKNKKSTF